MRNRDDNRNVQADGGWNNRNIQAYGAGCLLFVIGGVDLTIGTDKRRGLGGVLSSHFGRAGDGARGDLEKQVSRSVFLLVVVVGQTLQVAGGVGDDRNIQADGVGWLFVCI